MNTSSPDPRPPRLPAALLPAALLLLPLALSALPAHAHDDAEKSGDVVCSDPPLRAEAVNTPAAAWASQITGTPLYPGQTVATLGTNLTESPELSKDLIVSTKKAFTGENLRGVLRQRIFAGHDGQCKVEWQVQLKPGSVGCVEKLRITKFIHPLDIVADFRDDQNGTQAADFARRSNNGKVFDFRLSAKVCAGQKSRWLLLNTNIDVMQRKGTVQLFDAANERLTLPLPTYVPQ